MNYFLFGRICKKDTISFWHRSKSHVKGEYSISESGGVGVTVKY